jgi:hypothetical protein
VLAFVVDVDLFEVEETAEAIGRMTPVSPAEMR